MSTGVWLAGGEAEVGSAPDPLPLPGEEGRDKDSHCVTHWKPRLCRRQSRGGGGCKGGVGPLSKAELCRCLGARQGLSLCLGTWPFEGLLVG